MTISGPRYGNGANGPVGPTVPFPKTIATGITYDSGVIQSQGAAISVWVEADQALSLVITQYADYPGTIQVASATQAVSASTLTNKLIAAGAIFSTFRITLANSSGSLANISALVIVQ